MLILSGEISSNSEANSIWEPSTKYRMRLPALGTVNITCDSRFRSQAHKIFLTVSDLVARPRETAGRSPTRQLHPSPGSYV